MVYIYPPQLTSNYFSNTPKDQSIVIYIYIFYKLKCQNEKKNLIVWFDLVDCVRI